MSIAQQSAMPPASPRARRSTPRQLSPERHPGRTLAKIASLIACTALGAATLAGAVGLALVMLVSRVGG